MLISILLVKYFNVKKSFLILAVGLTIFSAGCVEEKKQSSFRLNGTIARDAPKFIIMKYSGISDTAIIKNNQFQFDGSVDFPTKAELVVPPASTLDKPFYIENTDIKTFITIENKNYKGIDVNFITLDSINGTETVKIRRDFERFVREHNSKIGYRSKLFLKLRDIFEKNPSHKYSGYLLSEIAKKEMLEQKELYVLFAKLDTTHQDKQDLKSIKKILFPKTGIQIGKKMIDFSLPNEQGLMINTAKYRGKILLIDFWASWCAPCRKQNPELIRIFNKGNLDVLGVSIDTKKDNWLTAIKTDNIPWDNVLEVKGFESDILIAYDVLSSIPHNFLIDELGTVIGIDISLEKLEHYLESKINVLPKI